MTSRTFILARDYREAVQVARKRGLARSEWRYVMGPQSLLGVRGATLLRTPCWWATRKMAECWALDDAIRAAELDVTYVECP